MTRSRLPPVHIHEHQSARAESVIHQAVLRLLYEDVPRAIVAEALIGHVVEIGGAGRIGPASMRRKLAAVTAALRNPSTPHQSKGTTK